jgi:hypothetical protein
MQSELTVQREEKEDKISFKQERSNRKFRILSLLRKKLSRASAKVSFWPSPESREREGLSMNSVTVNQACGIAVGRQVLIPLYLLREQVR